MGIEASRSIGKSAARLARAVELTLATVDLSVSQYRTLLQLAEGMEASSSLARKLAVTAPSVTAIVDGLVQRGMIERAYPKEDRRKVSLELTAAGREVLEAANAAVDDRLGFIASHLPDAAAQQEALASLHLWGDALDAYRAARAALESAEKTPV